MLITQARNLAATLLAAELPGRWKHVRAVAVEASRLARLVEVDPETVVAAAWLHDIGYAAAVAACGFHPLDGARYLQSRGWPSTVCGLVAHHTCARVEAERRGLLVALTTEFADSPGTERDVLWSADATTGPDGSRMTLGERVAEIRERYGRDDLVSSSISEVRSVLNEAIRRIHRAAPAALHARPA